MVTATEKNQRPVCPESTDANGVIGRSGRYGNKS